MRASARRLALLALALALPLALAGTGFHLVATPAGPWRGLSDPPGPARLLLSAAAAAAFAWALRRAPAHVTSPLLWLCLAGAPLLTVATGWLPALLAVQGPMLVLVGAMTLTVVGLRSGLSPRPWLARSGATLFLAALAFHLLVGLRIPGPAGPQGDEPHYLAMAQSLRSDSDLDLRDEFAGREYAAFFAGELEPHTSPRSPRGRLYSLHAPGLPALILPAYVLGGYGGVRVLLSALVALAGVLVWRHVQEIRRSPGLALAAWAVFALTPPLAFFGVAVYPEVPAALATAVFLLTSRRDSRGGALVAASLAAAALPWLHPKFLPLAALGLGLTLVRRGPRAPRVVAGLVPLLSLLGLLAWFEATFGRASFAAAYGPGFASDVAARRVPWGLPALFLDRQFGLLAVAPVFVLALPGALRLWTRQTGEALRALLLSAAVLVVGGAFSMWWGGSCPPARFVVPALPALAILLAGGLERWPGVGAALGGFGLGVVAVAAQAPRALHNRGDSESALLRVLAPGVDLDGLLPSFVVGDERTVVLAATLAGALALAWALGRRGALLGGLAFLAVAGAGRAPSLIDARQAALRALQAWDGDNMPGPDGPFDPLAVRIDLDLRQAPWVLRPGDVRASRRVDLPPGLFRMEVEGSSSDAEPGSRTARLEMAAEGQDLGSLYLRAGLPAARMLDLPQGARRLMLHATGVQHTSVIRAVRLVPLSVRPRSRRGR
jgi:hypothetical protein